MEKQLLITCIIIIVLALGLDVVTYLFLRTDWKKNGTLITDRLLSRWSDALHQQVKVWQNSISVNLVKYYQESVAQPAPASVPVQTPRPAPAPAPVPAPVVDAVPVEIVPVSFKKIGQVRRVQFSLEMPWDTQVEVRIGATYESGVTVEKREL